MALFRKPRSPFWWYDFTYAGKRYRGSTREKTKSAAGTVEAALLTALDKGTPAPRSAKTPSVREFSVRFLQWATSSVHSLENNSKRYYHYGVRLLLLSELADVPIDRLSRETVECVRFQRPVIDKRTNQPTDVLVDCSPSYTNQALRTLKAMCGMALDWKVLQFRPTFGIAKEMGRDQLISDEMEIRLEDQMQQLTIHGRHNRMRQQAWLVMVILQDTGMRPDEVFPMRIENIHWESNRIWVPSGKSPKARRFVAMSERMKDLLHSWCLNRNGWVFPSSRSASGHLQSIAKGFQQARKRAELDPKLVPYSARHTYATYQVEATGNLFAVSRQMGHANIKSMEPYQHQNTATLSDPINRRNKQREERRSNLLIERHNLRHTTQTIQ